MALLGSNHARNNAAAQDAKDWADTIRPFLLRIVAQCQEKPIDEAFPASSDHATVIVDVAFQISEDSPEPVVRVGHAINQLPGVPSTMCLTGVTIPPVALPTGFQPEEAEYIVKGICQECQKSTK